MPGFSGSAMVRVVILPSPIPSTTDLSGRGQSRTCQSSSTKVALPGNDGGSQVLFPRLTDFPVLKLACWLTLGFIRTFVVGECIVDNRLMVKLDSGGGARP